MPLLQFVQEWPPGGTSVLRWTRCARVHPNFARARRLIKGASPPRPGKSPQGYYQVVCRGGLFQYTRFCTPRFWPAWRTIQSSGLTGPGTAGRSARPVSGRRRVALRRDRHKKKKSNSLGKSRGASHGIIHCIVTPVPCHVSWSTSGSVPRGVWVTQCLRQRGAQSTG